MVVLVENVLVENGEVAFKPATENGHFETPLVEDLAWRWDWFIFD